MPGSTPRSSKGCHASFVPMSERQQLKLVRQLEIGDCTGENSGKESGPLRPRSRSCNGRGETPLHKAAIKGDVESVNKLLEDGADPNVPDFAGWTPLHEACNHGWYGIALALIQAGASVNARGFDDDTPLHDAAINGHINLVRLLIEQGADVHSRNKNGKTPFDVAAPGLMPHILKSHSLEKIDLGKKGNVKSGSPEESDSTATSELRQELQSQTKASSKSPRVKLKFHSIKKKSEKLNPEASEYNSDNFQFSIKMDEKNGKEDIYEFKSSKEATPVRGNSTSPEVDKTTTETKNDKAGDGYAGTEKESGAGKRALSEVGDTDENEEDMKKKKRKDGEGKDAGISIKAAASAGRASTARSTIGNPEKGGKASGHTVNKNSGLSTKTASTTSGVNVTTDKKSPSSPKGSTTPSNGNTPPNNGNKLETDPEDKTAADGDKVDQAPKVPPLKIVIPQQTANEPEQGNRNGKSNTMRHHQALPYVVSSNSNDSEKEGARSRSASPTDSFKSDEKKDPAIGMLSAEDQKGSLHHQRVLRSAHRSGPGSNGEPRAPDPAASRGNNGNGQNCVAGAGASGSGVSTNSNNASSGGTASASTDNPSPQTQNRSSPSPQVDSNSSTTAPCASGSNENPSTTQISSNYRSNSTAPSKPNGSSSNSTLNAGPEDKTLEASTDLSQTPLQSAPSNPAPVELHPRKRKLKHNKEVKEAPLAQVATERCESATTSTEIHPHDQPVKNCYQLFLDIRKQIERRRKGLFPVQPKPPQGFKDYLMNRCTYALAGNASTRQIPSAPLPQNISSPMKDLFAEQEKERHRLRLQHVIEKEKLVLSVEQEILRVHGRAARALANQSLPFSACTILKDEEVYNFITPEQEEKDRNARSRYNGRLFLSWLQDVDDKWEKIKEAMLLRHHNEAESLHAVQKMDWEWKMKELGSCEFKSKPVILDSHVPMVHVSDDFDLLPA